MVLREKLQRLSLMKFKIGLHAVQAVFTVIAWILTIAVIAKPGGNSSATYWYFFLTWMTFAALAYQALIPLWQRTKRFKNIYACFALDVLFTIFWVSAFASVQVWTASGVPSNSTGYCKGFIYGDGDRCTISFGTVILGVLMFLTFLIASGISGYKVWYFRKNGYCISQRPSISKPVEAKFVYPEENQSVGSGTTGNRDIEKGAFTVAQEGLHPGRKLSWDAAPLSAPACAPDFPEAKPTFRNVTYERPSETSPLTQYPPINRRPITNIAPDHRMSPPKLQLYGPGDRTPALVMDYGATTPYGAPDPYAPSLRYSNNPYPVSPMHQNYRSSIAPAPYTANYNQQPMYHQQGGQNAFMGGYRSNYASGIPAGNYRSNYASGIPAGGYDTYNRRGSQMRMAMPGPASHHNGGYHSAYHTPLPSAMMSPRGNGYSGFKRESTIQFYSQQQAFADKGFYAR